MFYGFAVGAISEKRVLRALCPFQMNASNLATVFAPNLVHSAMGTRRPESVMSEIELNNIIVEKLIESSRSIFH